VYSISVSALVVSKNKYGSARVLRGEVADENPQDSKIESPEFFDLCIPKKILKH
jgi:hypothetical protein